MSSATTDNVLSHISIVSLLGEGSFGSVYKALNSVGINNWSSTTYYKSIEDKGEGDIAVNNPNTTTGVNISSIKDNYDGREKLQPRIVAGKIMIGIILYI